jgi:hypothetical protein
MHVYVTIKALESMALMTRWIKILSCRDVKEVFLDATKEDIDHYYENYDEDYSYINDNSVSPISQLIRDGYISPNPAKQKILDIKNSPEKVLEDPSAIYFLDVTTEEADCIQKKYGVICKNESDIDDTELNNWGEIISCEGELDHSWKEILSKIRQSPTNTIIVSDRYIFSNDKNANDRGEGETYSGMDNVVEIINAILPLSFSKNNYYDVLILFSWKLDKTGRTCPISFNKIAKKLAGRIKSLRDSYNIRVEVVSIPYGAEGYEKTHNRRVVTNYHVIRTEQDLKAFRGDKSICSQTINWDSLFSKGIIDNNDRPIKNHVILVNGISYINSYGTKHLETCMYEYSIDGICPKSAIDNKKVIFSEIQNRLVKSVMK